MSSRASIAVAAALLALPFCASAQVRPAPVVSSHRWSDSIAVDSAVARRGGHRYPAVGAALGLVLPGLGHLYSAEYKRGAVLFAVTMTGAYFALNDASPQAAAGIGSVFYVGGWLFSIVDGAFAADRYNRHHAAPAIARNR